MAVADFGEGGLVAPVREKARHTNAKEAFIRIFPMEHDGNGST